MRSYWNEVGPPPNIVLMGIAAGVGVTYGGASPSNSPTRAGPELADPFAVQSLIGQADVGVYQAPRKGLIN